MQWVKILLPQELTGPDFVVRCHLKAGAHSEAVKFLSKISGGHKAAILMTFFIDRRSGESCVENETAAWKEAGAGSDRLNPLFVLIQDINTDIVCPRNIPKVKHYEDYKNM